MGWFQNSVKFLAAFLPYISNSVVRGHLTESMTCFTYLSRDFHTRWKSGLMLAVEIDISFRPAQHRNSR